MHRRGYFDLSGGVHSLGRVIETLFKERKRYETEKSKRENLLVGGCRLGQPAIRLLDPDS